MSMLKKCDKCGSEPVKDEDRYGNVIGIRCPNGCRAVSGIDYHEVICKWNGVEPIPICRDPYVMDKYADDERSDKIMEDRQYEEEVEE